ncbi:Telomerase reverse transcriptase [Extremus antarcticus]|uniref:Telomerase reverse transcriptase n=1 Tax=Extremus antarcticus TaxID=702011 RepID=A0AAJ0G8W8_9PEZI|nr:Telomerase reverse transcriptase [Extremus antarcticus]
MSVEYSKLPGQTFYRKTLSALKLQMQPMLLSTSYNSLPTVLSNLRHSFIEVAQKSYHYIHSLPASKQPPNKLITRTIDDLIKLACVLMKRRERTKKDTIPYGYCVSGAQARW